MKTLSLIFLTLWLTLSFPPSASVAREGELEEYVYLLKSEGGKVYRITESSTGDRKESFRKEIRRMELIPPGATLEIERGAAVSLTCGGCRVLNLTHKDSPYGVKMEDFKKEGSTSSKIMAYFTQALNHYIHPDSKPGSKANMGTRGHPDVRNKGRCEDLLPQDNVKLILIEPITFRWGLKGTYFSVEIKEFESKATIYSKKTSLKRIDVPAKIFKPGREYEWSVLEEETGERCYATFALLPEDQSSRIIEIVNHLPALLPSETDKETKCRLQAGYLASEGLHYDVWKWLERNGISQQY